LLGAKDIENLKTYEAMKVYKALYWDRLFLDKINDSQIALIIFDNAVNCGPGTAMKLVNESINKVAPWLAIKNTGRMRPETVFALNSIDRVHFGFHFFKAVQSRYITIVKQAPPQMVFLNGWINRTYKILENIL